MAHNIPYYLDYLSPAILERLTREGEPVAAVPGLTVAPGLRAAFPAIETDESLGFACALYKEMRDSLRLVLDSRARDRVFIDAFTKDARTRNEGRAYLSPEYETVIGAVDESDRIVVGPLPETDGGQQRAQVHVPEFLAGEQITLFGPPDTAKMSINAMNTLHRRLPDEPAIVAELVAASGQVPRWGADNEDSKTPIMRDLLQSCRNLIGCFDGTLTFDDPANGKTYSLAEEGLARPIKRIPGLALPDGNHLLDGNPLPLHLYDFATHLFHNWSRPEALVFYIPKLENEHEAAYVKALIAAAEARIQAIHPTYQPGTVRLFIVFENPRAIFRIREMAENLAPHFVGGSLGWHDFLGSTARMFKNDPNYRIPVKADPHIVINHIRESHLILVDALSPIGGIKIGGMYGILYEQGNPASFEVSMVGYIKDVITQLRRGLDGFWVAHPNFVRLGIALVHAWRLQKDDVNATVLDDLIRALVHNPTECEPLLAFVHGDDVDGLGADHPLYTRGVLVADIEVSDVIANDDPEEIRYNIFQALQYLADWLNGNGCVALPAIMTNAAGERVFVRIMDDLATTERSRWELWAEIAHGRVSIEQFDALLAEEIAFIREGRETPTKRVQVAWDGDAARWYPIAVRLLRQLVIDADPVEFAPELLLPFTLDFVRNADDPWAVVSTLCPGRYRS